MRDNNINVLKTNCSLSKTRTNKQETQTNKQETETNKQETEAHKTSYSNKQTETHIGNVKSQLQMRNKITIEMYILQILLGVH